MEQVYRAYMQAQMERLISIDSTTGFYREVEAYLAKEVTALGYTPTMLRKGGLTVDLGGEGNGLMITAHADDIGFMVRFVNEDGSLRVCRVGGLHPFQVEHLDVRVHTRDGRVYTGTLRRPNCSLHLMSMEERAAACDYEKNLFVYLDEAVHSRADVAALGIRCGDQVALEPNFQLLPSGYIKSRFLDDKASVAVLLTFMKRLKEENITLSRHVTAHFSLYEEIGHGGASGIPEDTVDVLAIDIGCCGPANYSDEHKVSICVVDATFPYHQGFIDDLIAAAEQGGVGYVLDAFLPYYGSDANMALKIGLDVRHALIGPGVLETHGYERTHMQSLIETYKLLCAYVG